MQLHNTCTFIGMVLLLCSTFLCITTYAQQSNTHGEHSLKDAADSAGALKTDTTGSAGSMVKSHLPEQRDVFDILKEQVFKRMDAPSGLTHSR
jgi:hypothetical protein